MFARAESFDQEVSGWSVGGVRNMSYMFCKAKSFNQPLSRWDVSHVVAMDGMFKEALSFNQSLSVWDVSHVQTFRDIFRWSGMQKITPIAPLSDTGMSTFILGEEASS
jgi:hypothetical protein